MNDNPEYNENWSPPAGILTRYKEIFLHPVRFMETHQFADHPFMPLLIVAIALIGLRFALMPELKQQYSSDEFLEWYSSKQGISEDEARSDIERMNRAAPYMSLIEAPIVVTAGVAGLSVVLFLIARVQYKRKPKFTEIFCMVSWGSLVSAVPLALQALYRFIAGQKQLPTSIASLLPESMNEGYLYNILLAIDPFLIWQIWLIGLGTAVIFQVSRQRAMTSVGTMFVVLAVLNAMALSASAK